MQPLLIRLSDAERSILDALVQAGHGSRAAVIREALHVLDNEAAARDPERNRMLAELADELAGIGVSLTAITRRLSVGEEAEAALLGAVLPSLIALVEATRQELQGQASASVDKPMRARTGGRPGARRLS